MFVAVVGGPDGLAAPRVAPFAHVVSLLMSIHNKCAPFPPLPYQADPPCAVVVVAWVRVVPFT
eukprot:m.54681 g.54681  ORF g.54681 m.54681 type:complete len:63 (+) comp9208_c0_seq1:207-395(+)